eukprot:CAMPEP_0167765910 /NCGR_PEP_ID=MMETSP0110_2-20121227/14995_1 /TAXON_ID=629695 /ORGANISM="Gymnochlora sp., Strain CCMP2014" /LENGTH=932 /DNA_ID=CAMNT_0007653767 /DNA_START=100 /DNA_END=2897 /DNA_ORIENTATION=+
MPFQFTENATACAYACDRDGHYAFIYADEGPTPSGCWCKSLTDSPTLFPTASPKTSGPTVSPSKSPSLSPSATPSVSPTASPSKSPSLTPSATPSVSPTSDPSNSPSESPTMSPSRSPGTTHPYTTHPSSSSPTASPSKSPSLNPSATPSVSQRSTCPSASPSGSPSEFPTDCPSVSPSQSPSESPSSSPSMCPSNSPSVSPSMSPTISPSSNPTTGPTSSPSASPTASPTQSPTELTCPGNQYIATFAEVNYNGGSVEVLSSSRGCYCHHIFSNVESEFGDWECGETTCLTSSGVNKASVPIETSECTCPEDVGFFEVESLCSCSVEFGQLYGDCTCPIGYSTESTTAECVACENGEFPNRFAYHEFGGGFDEGPGIATLDYITPCVCPSGNYLNGYCVTNKPDECPFGYFFSQDITDGLLMAGVGVCVPCPQGFIMNQDDGGVCSCFTDLGWTLNGNACVCDSEACGCPYGMIYSADQRRCVVPQCRDSYYGQFFTETLEIGLSGEELTENSMYFCACSAYAKRAYESNSGWLDICDESCRNDVSHYMSSLPPQQCIETIGYIYQDDLGTCLPGDETKCMIGWGYNPAESTQCNACDLGFAYDTSTSEGCYCPQISNLNQCFWPSDLECPDHYAYDVYSNQCRACPTGHIYSPSRKKCVCYTAGGWQIAKSLDRTSEDNFQQIMGADICWCPTDDCSCDVPGDVPGVYVYSEETGTCVIAEDYVLVCDENEIIGEYGSIASGELTTYKGCFCRHDGFNFLDTVTGKWSCRRDTCHADLLDGTISPAYSTELADNCICASEFTYGIPVSEGFEEGGERSIQDGLTVSCHCETTAYLSSHYPEACSCPIGYATDYDNHICIPCSDGTIPNMRRPSNTLTPQLLQTNSACVCPSQEYDANGRCITYFEAECPFGYYFDTENLDPSYQGNGGIC